MSFTTETLEAAHQHCTANRHEIGASKQAACFYCLSTYPAGEVTEFLIDGTALCPKCPVDSVLGDASGYPATDPNFLAAMHRHWFERTVSLPEASFRILSRKTRNWLSGLFGIGLKKKKLNA